MLDSISGSDAATIRRLVEKYAGKAGDNNAGAAAGTGIDIEGVGPAGKVSLPPALETTRPSGIDDANADAAVGKENGGTSLANGNVGGTMAPPASSTTATEDPTEELNKRLPAPVKAMLFMKGTPSAPQCGFIRTFVGILRKKGVGYGFLNILAVRQGLRVFLYVSSSFFPHSSTL